MNDEAFKLSLKYPEDFNKYVDSWAWKIWKCDLDEFDNGFIEYVKRLYSK